MRKKRILAAAVSLAVAAGQFGTVAFADNDNGTGTAVSTGENSAPADDAATSDEETTGENDLGDINGDGRINITDVSALAAHIKGVKALNKRSLAAADINADGRVTVTDLGILAGHIKGLSSIKSKTQLPIVKNPREEMQDKVQLIEFSVDKNTKTVSWNAVKDMKQYVVVITNGEKTVTQTTEKLSVDIPYDMFRDGKLTVMVAPFRTVQTEDGRRTKDYGDTIGYTLGIKPDMIHGAITVTDDKGKAKIDWKAADFASGYHVYDITNTAKDGKPKLIADTATNQLITDFPVNATVKMLIVPFNSVGEAEGVNAEMIGGNGGGTTKPDPDPKPDPKPETKLAAPTINSNYYYSDLNSVTFYWNAVKDAEGYEASIAVNSSETVTREIKTTTCTIDGLPQRKEMTVKVRAYKTVDGKKEYSDAVSMSVITDGYVKCSSDTPIYSAAAPSAAQLGTLKKGDTAVQTGTPDNGWIKVFVPSSGGTQTGYVPASSVKDYAVVNMTIINQNGDLGGSPAVLGGEETALASVLNYQFNINVSKNTLIDYYMPELALTSGKIDADPNYVFWGSPYHMESDGKGYGVYAPVVAESAHWYLKYIGVRGDYNIALNTDYSTGENVNNLKIDAGKLDVGDAVISGGLDINGLKAELDRGRTPIVWYSDTATSAECTQTVTAGQKYSNPGTGTYNFTWYGRETTAVLTGYDDALQCFYLGCVNNLDKTSQYGYTTSVSYDDFMKTYTTLGRQSVVITKK
ncbi:dockerin type I domain-containing protein [uncultured Ruminococcus sp.]|uniref:dockerin type I domain-containing protein n=1 Tax=uncultured Ruminococcus sp. TaxID=165186 RepID=UPI0025CEF0A2|nr:dockerin type I domain-containing protein [uncultured Ruminococcus sp.]